MKRLRLAAVILIVVLSLSATVFAQKLPLPGNLMQQSTLADILKWLDETSFQTARIGIVSDIPDPEPDELITDVRRYYESAVFSSGFRLDRVEDCGIFLRANRLELLAFTTKYPNPNEGSLSEYRAKANYKSKSNGMIYLPLNFLKPKKPPYAHTKKAEKARLLGSWRTSFELKPQWPWRIKKGESMFKNALRIEVFDSDSKREAIMYGDEVAFIFDDKVTAEKFHVAFSRAIDLCRN